MANGKSGRKKLVKKLITTIIALVIVFVASLFGIDLTGEIPNETTTPTHQEVSQPVQNVEGQLIVHMIDVGQGDSFLLIQEDDVVLVDCGKNGRIVLEYIKNLGITELDYVIGTHPHDDHMGGMYALLTDEDIEVGTVVISEGTPESSTTWFPKLMTELNNGEYQIHHAKENDIFTIGEAKMQVLIAETEDIADKVNNYSICMKVSFA